VTNIISVEELIADLRRTGVRLWEEAGRLRYRAPKGVLTPDRLDALRDNKEAVIAWLRETDSPVVLRPDHDARYDPFPLTDVQAAYLLGRGQVFEYGGVACHVYLEIHYPRLDAGRAEHAWNRLVERHDMLRVVIEPEGYQRVLPTVPRLVVPELDLRGLDDARARAELAAVRASMDHAIHDTTTWPVFALRLTQTEAHTVLHLSMDFLVADWTSIWTLLGEFEALYAEPARELPPLGITFRDYVIRPRPTAPGLLVGATGRPARRPRTTGAPTAAVPGAFHPAVAATGHLGVGAAEATHRRPRPHAVRRRADRLCRRDPALVRDAPVQSQLDGAQPPAAAPEARPGGR
jgi:pyochelin synthetase